MRVLCLRTKFHARENQLNSIKHINYKNLMESLHIFTYFTHFCYTRFRKIVLISLKYETEMLNYFG